jgi:hypothetical protein
MGVLLGLTAKILKNFYGIVFKMAIKSDWTG